MSAGSRASTALVLAELLQRVAVLEADRAALLARLEALERRGHGARDDADRGLLEALRVASDAGTFTAADAMKRARLDAEFRTALLKADVETIAGFGYWARRMTGAGLVRCGRSSTGVVWGFE